MRVVTGGLQDPGALRAGLHVGARGLWQVRTLLQEVRLPGGLGTGACGRPHTAGGFGILGGLGSETDDSVDTQSETEGEAKNRALARALSTDWHPSEMAAVPDSFGNGAISLHTRSSVFESLWWVAHGAHPAIDI